MNILEFTHFINGWMNFFNFGYWLLEKDDASESGISAPQESKEISYPEGRSWWWFDEHDLDFTCSFKLIKKLIFKFANQLFYDWSPFGPFLPPTVSSARPSHARSCSSTRQYESGWNGSLSNICKVCKNHEFVFLINLFYFNCQVNIHNLF